MPRPLPTASPSPVPVRSIPLSPPNTNDPLPGIATGDALIVIVSWQRFPNIYIHTNIAFVGTHLKNLLPQITALGYIKRSANAYSSPSSMPARDDVLRSVDEDHLDRPAIGTRSTRPRRQMSNTRSPSCRCRVELCAAQDRSVHAITSWLLRRTSISSTLTGDSSPSPTRSALFPALSSANSHCLHRVTHLRPQQCKVVLDTGSADFRVGSLFDPIV